MKEQAVDIGLQQLQEFFCDFVGLFIFGQAYLDCFDYLLSPTQSKERHPPYPAVRERARALVRNMPKLSLRAPGSFEDRFAVQKCPFEASEPAYFHLSLSDDTSSRLANEAADLAFKLCNQGGLVTPKSADATRILKEFESGVPAEKVGSLGAILNAARRAFKSQTFLPGVSDHKRMAYLNELILKSIEILEMEGFISNAAKTQHG